MFGKKKNNNLPVLKAGDVVHCDDGRWVLVINSAENGIWGYLINDQTLTQRAVCLDHNRIGEIYRSDDGTNIFGDGELVELVEYRPEKWRIWKRENSVKEMTVDEISKALGYEVKVVGNDRR